MSTGDIKGNFERLRSDVKSVMPGVELDTQSALGGQPSVFLPVLHHVFLDYSRLLAKWLSDQGHDLYARSDLRFLEGVFRIVMSEFNYRPRLSTEQFLSPTGFAEQKMLFVSAVVRLCRKKHTELFKKSRPSATFPLHMMQSKVLPPSVAVLDEDPDMDVEEVVVRHVKNADPSLDAVIYRDGAKATIPLRPSRPKTAPIAATTPPRCKPSAVSPRVFATKELSEPTERLSNALTEQKARAIASRMDALETRVESALESVMARLALLDSKLNIVRDKVMEQ
eukprot:gnl/Hemi2/8280_TR2852_c0_g5_i1.p1 gnl/Hemi2/8280_TR2852_c0_g5~~gnl/Hemi2/8280_TR2852_c0_g5_i1.p1  ORF type:complete len:281 (-),score=57.84 gnl/Hemi2/8280_TR2852_c0_g5_i1:77-919(-)